MTDVVSNATPEQQAAAMEIGWIPPEKFKGNPDTFVDAEEYIQRGEHLLPIIKARNRKLEETVAQLNGRLAAQEEAIAANKEALAALQEHHTRATEAQVKKAREDLIASLKQAREAGDVDAEMEILGELAKPQAAEPEPKAKAKEPEPHKAPEITPEVKAFMDANPWFGGSSPEDQERTIEFNAMGMKLRARGNKNLGQAFLDDVVAALEKATPRGSTKVEGAGGGQAQVSLANPQKKRFADLPREAKEACWADNGKFVGEGKLFAKQADWEQYFVDLLPE